MNPKLLLSLFGAVLLAALDIAILGPILPAFREQYQISLAVSSWIVTIYVLANLVGTSLLGALADRRGQKQSFSLSLGLMTLGTLVIALEPSFPVLLTARALQGFGAGGLFPIAASVIGLQVPAHRQGRMLGLLGATFGIAFLIGPPAAGLVQSFAHWTWIFWCQLPFLLTFLALATSQIPSDKRHQAEKLDFPGLMAFSAGLTFLALGFSRLSATNPWLGLLEPLTCASLAIGTASLVGFVFWETRSPSPFIHPGLFTPPALRRAFLLALAAGLGEMGVALLPDLAVETLGATKSSASLLLGPLVIGIILGSLASGRLLERTGPRPLLVAGLIAQGSALTAFGLAPASRELFWLAGPLFGAGLSCLLAGPLRWIVLRASPSEHRTAAQSQLSVSILVGQITAAPLMGALAGIRLWGNPQLHFLFAGAASFGFVLVALGLPRHFPVPPAA